MHKSSLKDSSTAIYSTGVELKGIEKTGCFSGYASVFNQVDDHGDIILPGAFAKTLSKASPAVKLLWQHHVEEPIGLFEALHEDSYGLKVNARIMLELAKGREVYALIASGVITGLSIGYRPSLYHYDSTGIRYLESVDLREISVVTFPANAKAHITEVKEDQQHLLQKLNRLITDINGRLTGMNSISFCGIGPNLLALDKTLEKLY